MTNTLKNLLHHPQGRLGLILLCVLSLAIVFGPWLAPYSPEDFHITARLQGPSAAHLLGTDQFGRDILSRLLWGARSTVLFALLATVLATIAGTAIGVLSGYLGGIVDDVIMRIIDAVMAIPNLLFALLIITVLGASGINAVIAIGIAFSPGLARVARSVTLGAKQQDYVSAAVARGEHPGYIMVFEVLPNMIAPVIVEATIRVAFAVMLLATLSYLGLGAQPPAPEWGLMIAEARGFMFKNPWTIVWPGLAIGVVAIAFNLLGDGLRDVLNPRTHG